MSRSYAIRIPIEVLLSENLRNRLADFRLNFPLLDILPPERMQEMLKKRLIEAGFLEIEAGLVMPTPSGQTAIFDPATMEMRLSIAVPETHNTRMYEESINWMEEQIKRALAAGTVLEKAPGSELASRLAEQMAELAVKARAAVNAVLKDVYREAIREKAGQLGSVSNVSESSDGSTFRIRIEVDA